MNVLLTNDDGIDAPGLRALSEALPKHANVVIVAPANEKSASSHSITLGQKLRLESRKSHCGTEYLVHGTPADCVKLAIAEIEGFVPDLIVSGINQGANTGVSVYYSGTISAAREGLINRFPSIAVSLCGKNFKDFSSAVAITEELVEGYKAGLFPRHLLLNVNVPPLPAEEIRGVRITKQADSHFIEEFMLEKEHENTRVFNLVGEIEIYDPDGTSDVEAIDEGFISITPLKLDLTDHEAMPIFKKWVEKGLSRHQGG